MYALATHDYICLEDFAPHIFYIIIYDCLEATHPRPLSPFLTPSDDRR